MVELVENWEDLEKYAEFCRVGIYQIRKDVDGTEVRVHVGRFGYKHVFKDPRDQKLRRILEFCNAEGFIKIRGSIPEEQFFTTPAEAT